MALAYSGRLTDYFGAAHGAVDGVDDGAVDDGQAHTYIIICLYVLP